MTYRDDIFDLFHAAQARDLGTPDRPGPYPAPDWLIRWDYQDQRRGELYGDGLPRDFERYDGPQTICRWFGWMGRDPWPDYFPEQVSNEFLRLSERHDRKVCETYGLDFDFAHYGAIGRGNVQDYLFQNFYLVPERMRPRRVLDFGAGFGRQSNLWSQLTDPLTMVGFDAIPQSYCLQHMYYAAAGLPLRDYVVDPEIDLASGAPGLYHVPTWRHDLLPDGYFDLVVCSQVLPELSPALALWAIRLFERVLAPGGALYIRDHAPDWNPSGIDLDPYIEQHGFLLEFRPRVLDRIDVHGIPRIWRKPAEGNGTAAH